MSQPPLNDWSKTAASGARRGLLVIAGLGLLTAIGVLTYRYLQPRWYHAEVEIENMRPDEGWNGPLASLSFPEKFDPPLQVLRKKEILYPVINTLDFTQVDARRGVRITKEEAFNQLLTCLRIDVRPDRARIGVYEHDPARAALCANTVAAVYAKRQDENRREYYERYASANIDAAEKQRPIVQAAAEEARRIRERDSVSDPDPEHEESVADEPASRAYREAKAKYLREKAGLEDTEDGVKVFRAEAEAPGPAIRIRRPAEPPPGPLPWWRGDPRE